MHYLLGIFAILLSFQIHSQDTSGFKNWQYPEDYEWAQKKFLKNIDWLIANPNISRSESVDKVFDYQLKWLSGCPYIRMQVDAKLLRKLSNKHPLHADFSRLFLIAKTGYFAKNLDEEPINVMAARVEAIMAVLEYYENARKKQLELPEEKYLEQLQRRMYKGKLHRYLKRVYREELK